MDPIRIQNPRVGPCNLSRCWIDLHPKLFAIFIEFFYFIFSHFFLIEGCSVHIYTMVGFSASKQKGVHECELDEDIWPGVRDELASLDIEKLEDLL